MANDAIQCRLQTVIYPKILVFFVLFCFFFSVASPVMNRPPQSHSPGGAGSGNILSKWFSEDVLQQATPAYRETTPDFSRKVMSVEELERQQAAAIN